MTAGTIGRDVSLAIRKREREIDRDIERLKAEKITLWRLGKMFGVGPKVKAKTKTKAKRNKMSPEGREKLRLAMRARWANAKKNGLNVNNKPLSKKAKAKSA